MEWGQLIVPHKEKDVTLDKLNEFVKVDHNALLETKNDGSLYESSTKNKKHLPPTYCVRR